MVTPNLLQLFCAHRFMGWKDFVPWRHPPPDIACVALCDTTPAQPLYGRHTAIAKAAVAPRLRRLHRFLALRMVSGPGPALPHRPINHPPAFGAIFVRPAAHR